MYRDLNDREIISSIRESDEDSLNLIYEKYEPLINQIASKLYYSQKHIGIELNDLIQEGMISLTNAIHTYDQDNEALFYTYAKKCIETRLISYIIKLNRQKHKFLNESISLDKDLEDYEFNKYEQILKDENSNPEELILELERIDEFDSKIKSLLTKSELEVYLLKIQGFDYKEIAKKLGRSIKSVDNALTRIKNKARTIKD
jgi:RNA polymerase sporulation-specific sigma factor